MHLNIYNAAVAAKANRILLCSTNTFFNKHILLFSRVPRHKEKLITKIGIGRGGRGENNRKPLLPHGVHIADSYQQEVFSGRINPHV